MKSAPSLSFELRRSRIAFMASIAIGLFAVVAAVLSGLPDGARIGLASVVAIAVARTLRELSTASISRCTLQNEGQWLISADGADHSATLHRSHDLGFLIALHFRTDSGRRIDLALWPDAIPAETRRRLRVWLGRQGGLR